MTYELLDSGNGRKLERVGEWIFNRQAQTALWKPARPAAEWKRAHGFHHRSETGGGRWEMFTSIPERWPVTLHGLRLWAKATAFGHLGFFPEHSAHWPWLGDVIGQGAARLGRRPEILNLFAYTGAGTLACALAGAAVCHVDAAKGVVDWGRENATLNQLDEKPIRWIVDDCVAFLGREIRRGRRYDGIILDPPSFGRGARGQVWKIEDQLPELLDLCREALVDDPLLVLLSCHSPGFTPLVLENLLRERFAARGTDCTSGEMTVSEGHGGRKLPAGAFARLGALARPEESPGGPNQASR